VFFQHRDHKATEVHREGLCGTPYLCISVLKKNCNEKESPARNGRAVVTAYYEKLTRYTIVVCHIGPLTKMMSGHDAGGPLMING
jgi:hypothetical protein